jgi:hypothetical protein
MITKPLSLAEALSQYNAMMEHIGGCSDGGCIIKKPRGMHTNGGCKCAKDYLKMQRVALVANQLRDAALAHLAKA